MHLCSCFRQFKISSQNQEIFNGTLGILEDVLKVIAIEDCKTCERNGKKVYFEEEEFYKAFENIFLLKSYVDNIYFKIKNPHRIKGLDFLIDFHKITHPFNRQEIFKILIEQLQATENFIIALENLINFMILAYLIKDKCIYILYPNAKFKRPNIEDVEFDGLAVNPNEGEFIFLETTFILDEQGLINHLKSKIMNFISVKNLITNECGNCLKIKFLYISFRQKNDITTWLEGKSFKYLDLDSLKVKILFSPLNVDGNPLSEKFKEDLKEFLAGLDDFRAF